MINFESKGDKNFAKLVRYLEKTNKKAKLTDLDKYGIAGVEALSSVTPRDTGLTAESWYYEIKRQNGSVIIQFNNSNVVKGVPIAIILDYGHGTRNGGWVEGRHYINPAIQPIFDRIVDDAWKEVTKS